jgi:putative intracellular protease/amidase
MMILSDELRNIIADILTSPKTTAAVGGTTAALGAAGLMDLIHTTLSLGAIAAGLLATLALARYHRANERNLRLRNQMLVQEMIDKGMTPEAD